MHIRSLRVAQSAVHWPARIVTGAELDARFGLPRGWTRENGRRATADATDTRRFAQKLPGDVTVGWSSGTTGPAAMFFVSASGRAAWAGVALARVLRSLSLRRPQRVAFFLRANSPLYATLGRRAVQFACPLTLRRVARVLLPVVLVWWTLERLARWWLIVRFFRREAARAAPTHGKRDHPITLVQPILSGDPGLGEALRANATLDASQSVRWKWLVDDNDLPGRRLTDGILAELAAADPDARRRVERILTPPAPGGVNPKTYKLRLAWERRTACSGSPVPSRSARSTVSARWRALSATITRSRAASGRRATRCGKRR